jgi:Flp pilus assembly protein TadD, contains TPR repeats
MFRKWIAMFVCAIPSLLFAQDIDNLIFNKNYQEALSVILKTLEVKQTAELYFKQGMIYRQLSMPMRAEESYGNSLALDSTNSRFLAEYADLQSELGNPFRAVPFYQKASLYSPEDYNLRYKLGRAYMSSENFEKAYEVFMMIRYKDSTNVVYNKQLALTAMRLGKMNQALGLFESVLDANPNDLGLYQNLITLYAIFKDAVHVIRTSERALYFFPENSSIMLRAANALHGLKEYSESIPFYEAYLDKNDSTFDVLKSYGLSLYFDQENVKSREILEKCFVLAQDDPILNFYLGLVCRKVSDIPKSIEYLDMAISVTKKGMTEMYHCLGQNFGLQREFEKSVVALKEAIACNPEKAEYLVEIGTTYEEFKSDKKFALEYYTKYLTQAGDSAPNSKFALDRIRVVKSKPNNAKR